ncbi:unnamed protein product, partial [Iphiclides podalirius]
MYGCSLNRTAGSIVTALVRSRGRQEVTSPNGLFSSALFGRVQTFDQTLGPLVPSPRAARSGHLSTVRRLSRCHVWGSSMFVHIRRFVRRALCATENITRGPRLRSQASLPPSPSRMLPNYTESSEITVLIQYCGTCFLAGGHSFAHDTRSAWRAKLCQHCRQPLLIFLLSPE